MSNIFKTGLLLAVLTAMFVIIGGAIGGQQGMVVAFLFAIYLVKPSPFCILDEVDAPLDDANIGRFLAMLREVSKKTQFVMITHNKKTMEVADYLYGVTMQEPGVSQLVSVRLGREAGEGRNGEPGETGEVMGNGAGDEEQLALEGSV